MTRSLSVTALCYRNTIDKLGCNSFSDPGIQSILEITIQKVKTSRNDYNRVSG